MEREKRERLAITAAARSLSSLQGGKESRTYQSSEHLRRKHSSRQSEEALRRVLRWLYRCHRMLTGGVLAEEDSS